jgi:hypothetical protein
MPLRMPINQSLPQAVPSDPPPDTPFLAFTGRDFGAVSRPMKTARRKAPIIDPTAPRKPQARSRVSNGRDVLPGTDGRLLISRRYRDIAAAILADQGPANQLSEARKQLIRRYAAASVLAEQMEAKLANGEMINITEHALLVSTLVRIAGRIGISIHRQTKRVPTLEEYLALKRETEDAEDVVSEAAE